MDSIQDENITLDDYHSLEIVEPPIQIFLVSVFSITATLSLVGNITVIIVLSLGKRSSRELRSFLINLAVSDVCMAIFSIPFTYTMFLLGRWIFSHWFCPIVMAMQHASVLVSVYTLSAIAFDRYRAVRNPFGKRLSCFEIGLYMACIWIFSLTISSIQLKVSSVTPFKYEKRVYYQCRENWSSEFLAQLYTIFVFCVTFFIPLITLGVLYCCVSCQLLKSSAPGNADCVRDAAHMKAKWKVVRMLLTIVILFVICWLPLQTIVMVFYFFPETANYFTNQGSSLYAFIYFSSLWLANANSFINPLIYCFMSENFRDDLRDIIRRMIFWRKPKHSLLRQKTYSTGVIMSASKFELRGSSRFKRRLGETRVVLHVPNL